MDELSGALRGPYRSWAVPAGTGRWVPVCELFSRDGHLVVQLDLPGIDPEKDVQVMLQDGVLCITGERRETGRGDDGYYRREWRYGAFERGFALPEEATGEGITASYRDGMLEIVVPKAAQRAEPRQIPVAAADGKTAILASGHADRAGSRGLPSRRPRRAHPLPAGPLRAQPLDQDRVGLERLRPVDQLVEQLVVPGRRHVEHLGDGLLLHARGPPATPLERQDPHVTFRQPGHTTSSD